MKYAMYPNCGRRLCKGEPGTKVELECPKCGKPVSVIIDIYGQSIQCILTGIVLTKLKIILKQMV